ncbi:di-heme-cytochrome C peroxidase [Methylomonas rhizoryzae]|uniref:di-heme-cytochrome C peroxidase n=1 Tax=Methylomonas rhizoryzae TaxID=2608981 RepID=UPI0018D6EE9E|nr:di-heme-cytochrome C peroxidase [Methylomonas rhizoryzae]
MHRNNNKALSCSRQTFFAIALSIGFFAAALPSSAAENTVYVEQGKAWTKPVREDFYSRDQGSRIMPLKWFQALKQASGEAFTADNMRRFGYLPNPASPMPGLPLGFSTNKEAVGMTCAACHTRQIEVGGVPYRIDGGPAIADFQGFAAELRNVVDRTLNDPAAFADFAQNVLGSGADAEKQAELKQALQDWFVPYRTLMDKALPKDAPWGPARLDAVGMIFNRLTGLDIGSPEHQYVIEGNIHLADAPVRYPFIWNAPIQDKTQWPGLADNGNDILGLARNFGEVVGVFAEFHPQKDDWRILGYDYLKVNSGNFDGLKSLENMVKKIGPPKWPWSVDKALAAQGKAIYESPSKTEQGGCAGCHGIRKGAIRSWKKTWATPLCNVGSDMRQFNLLTWTVDSGVMEGAFIPFFEKPIKAQDAAFNVLGVAVMSSVLQYEKRLVVKLEDDIKRKAEKLHGKLGIAPDPKAVESLRKLQNQLLSPDVIDLKGAFHQLSNAWVMPSPAEDWQTDPICKDDFTAPVPKLAYESRVMQGIWAAAPYLHNGSVPTLQDLLKPVAERPAQFKVGPAYDISKVGLAAEQSQFDYTYKTTDCNDRLSGNSRCGHEFGTKLNDQEKAALLEYLKIL